MGQSWFITGAGRGLGLEVAGQLLAGGHRVTATVRDAAGLDDLVATHGERLTIAVLDVTDTAALRAAVDAAFARGPVDVVLSNAGYGLFGAAEELSDAAIERLLATDLLAPIQLVRAVVPHLRAQGHGRIIQLSSSGGVVADPGMSVYNASKFGVEGFCESVAHELAPFGIDVVLVEPGGIRTGFAGSMQAADALPAYVDGVVGQIRRVLVDGADPDLARRSIRVDPARAARAIIDVAASTSARRVILGSLAHVQISAALGARIESAEAGRELAFSVDADE
jgi:NAD(P)-dependent dehydrogenase (short-subunit alcohol dehydrogenase family)